VPESYGKRQRQKVKERKGAAREERRVARNQRRADRAAGIDTESEDYRGEALPDTDVTEPAEVRPETDRADQDR
jgi:hypothetical protein